MTSNGQSNGLGMGLTTKEREMIGSLQAAGRLPSNTRVVGCEVFKQGNFTIAVVSVQTRQGDRGAFGKPHNVVGVAKRNCDDDQDNPMRGRAIAITRALRRDARLVR